MQNYHDYYQYQGKKLFWLNHSVENVAAKCGTPSLIYDIPRIKSNLNWITSVAKDAHSNSKIAVAIKAVGNSTLISSIRTKDLCCEVMTAEEFLLALRMGFESNQIVVNGLGWSDELLSLISKEIPLLVNVDNLSDCKRLSHFAEENDVVIPVSIRIVPSCGENFATLDEKLGTIPKFALDVINKMQTLNGVSLVSISVHALHCCVKIDEIKSIFTEIINYADAMGLLGNLQYIDVGGGLDTRVKLEENGIGDKELTLALKDAFSKLPQHITILYEPGRLLFGDAAIVLTSIRTIKQSLNTKWLIVDVGTNILVPIDAANFSVLPVFLDSDISFNCRVADGICSPTSTIGSVVTLPDNTKELDLLVIGNVGAYALALMENWGYSMPPLFMINEQDAIISIISREKARKMFFDFWETFEGEEIL